MGKEKKFKVGDKVQVVRSGIALLPDRSRLIGHQFEIGSYEGMWDGHHSWAMSPSNSYRWKESELELVNTSPVRERTIKEVVEWSNGKLHVAPHEAGSVLIGLAHPYDLQFTSFTADELTDTITHLTAIRDALASKE